MYLRAEILDDLLIQVFQALLEKGSPSEASRGRNLELLGVLLELDNPRARLSRSEIKGRPFSCIGEFLWYLSGSNQLEFIERYVPDYADDAEKDGTLHGAYGPRLYDMDGEDQLANVVRILGEGKRTTRRAVIQLYSAKDIAHRYNEIPCTTTIQFLLREERLHCCVSMRSNDAFRGLPHDAFCFTMLQEMIARDLGVELGTYKHFAGSLHLYEDRVNAAKEYLTEGVHSILPMPEMPLGPQWENVQRLISIEQAIREGAGYDAIDDRLPPYWQDLARLLLGYEISRDEAGIDNLIDKMAWSEYRIYLERRKTANRPKPRARKAKVRHAS